MSQTYDSPIRELKLPKTTRGSCPQKKRKLFFNSEYDNATAVSQNMPFERCKSRTRYCIKTYFQDFYLPNHASVPNSSFLLKIRATNKFFVRKKKAWDNEEGNRFFTLFHIGNQKLFFSFLSRGAGLTEPAPQTRPPFK